LPYKKVKALGQEREKTFRNLYRSNIKEIQGLTGFLMKMREMKIKAFLATLGDTPNIDLVLDELNIRKFFIQLQADMKSKEENLILKYII